MYGELHGRILLAIADLDDCNLVAVASLGQLLEVYRESISGTYSGASLRDFLTGDPG